MAAYYNEIDRDAAAWLRNLITAGHLPPGDVDERSIIDVRPAELGGYDQWHFFAGIGIWPAALRRCGWPDDRPVTTGSCPCQPFSSAGRSEGFGDSRHLWPYLEGFVRERRAVPFFGEQVASPDGLAWLDFVCADLEAQGFALGTLDTCAAGFGAPNIRQRLYFVAHPEGGGFGTDRSASRIPGHLDFGGGTSGLDNAQRDGLGSRREGSDGGDDRLIAGADVRNGWMADAGRPSGGTELQHEPGKGLRREETETYSAGSGERRPDDALADTTFGGQGSAPGGSRRAGQEGIRIRGDLGRRGTDDILVDTIGAGSQGCDGSGDMGLHRGTGSDGSVAAAGASGQLGYADIAGTEDGRIQSSRELGRNQETRGTGTGPGPVNGFWSDAQWVYCRDEKWRCFEPGTFPLAPRVPHRVGSLLTALRSLGRSTIAAARANRVARLKGYGNALNMEQASEFIAAYMDVAGHNR